MGTLVYFQKEIDKRANFPDLTHFSVIFMTLLFLYLFVSIIEGR